MKYFTTFIFSLLSIITLNAQQTSILFSGKILDGSKPLYNVTVVNTNNTTGTVTDNYGDFTIKVQANDLITFTSIGYKNISFKIPDTIQTDYRVLVSMVEDTILLREAVVVPWPINRTMLKEAMLSNRKEKETIAPYAGFREIEGDPVEPAPKPFANPISYVFSKLNKKARQEKKIEKYRQMLQESDYYTPEP